MDELPDDLPVVERRAVRVVVVDSKDRALLLHTQDPDRPEVGHWWELPGGGIEAGESMADAAVRELYEETGIVVTPTQVGPPTWRRRATFAYRQRRHVQDEVVVLLRLPIPGPELDVSHRLAEELEDYFSFRWWPLAELSASSERFYPGRLPELIDPLLRGEEVDEPFELWS
ncbi:NUDIX hydrolase [Kineosporia babensis]